MQLANEDNLRLNVLLRQELKAVRIDESKMIVYALTARGEGKVPLNPTCRDEQYLRLVREMLSIHALGSPGGYPVYIHRWTRMGQARNESLEKLLRLGEPEAVVAVAHAAGLSAELARHAWWALPNEENARTLLRHLSVITDSLGRELAQFLLEFLPFEAEPGRIVETVRLLLQPGLISAAERESLWQRASHKSAYYPGFLFAVPHDLPIEVGDHPDLEQLRAHYQAPAETGNVFAGLLLQLHEAGGRAFLQGIRLALKRPSNQDVVVALFNAIGAYFDGLGLAGMRHRRIDELREFSRALRRGEIHAGHERLAAELATVIAAAPDHTARIEAVLSLAQVNESLLDTLFGGNDAIGSVLRKQLAPLNASLLELVASLED